MGHSSVYDEDSGLVYVYGGQIGDRAVDDLLVYDPVTHYWSKRERYVPADKVTPSSLSFSFLVTWSQKLASPLSPPSLSLPLCLCHTRFNSLSLSLCSGPSASYLHTANLLWGQLMLVFGGSCFSSNLMIYNIGTACQTRTNRPPHPHLPHLSPQGVMNGTRLTTSVYLEMLDASVTWRLWTHPPAV